MKLSAVEEYERKVTWEIADNLLCGILSSPDMGDFDVELYCSDDMAKWFLWRNEWLRSKARKFRRNGTA